MTEELFVDDSDQLDPLKVLSHIQDPGVLSRWEGTLKEMVEIAETKLMAEMKEGVTASELSRHVVFAICNTLGGCVVYLPRGDALKRAMRDAAIFHEWKEQGVRPPDLAKKYRLVIQTIYEIIAKQRVLHRKNEPDLFGFDEGTIH
ncbi:transcriptional regulator [Pseudomonas chlororaphis]|uniref:Mor transcription activator family protein n=1 Tax=Pseudomonas chlororaphis TaxID=587753 RepID=UPI001E64B8C4|nr:Mor transcription activator family protein [Pseudomonas chlororaphis]MCB2251686.1 transcriptional regulator [Pseudomonas chlororaphis]